MLITHKYYYSKFKIQENPSGDFRRMYRYSGKGAWMLADRDHGWQVSDCTAEAIKVCIYMGCKLFMTVIYIYIYIYI
jgi:hypothetical protein